MTEQKNTHELSGTGIEFRRRQKAKNIALGLALLGLMGLLYVTSIVRMGMGG